MSRLMTTDFYARTVALVMELVVVIAMYIVLEVVMIDAVAVKRCKLL